MKWPEKYHYHEKGSKHMWPDGCMGSRWRLRKEVAGPLTSSFFDISTTVYATREENFDSSPPSSSPWLGRVRKTLNRVVSPFLFLYLLYITIPLVFGFFTHSRRGYHILPPFFFLFIHFFFLLTFIHFLRFWKKRKEKEKNILKWKGNNSVRPPASSFDAEQSRKEPFARRDQLSCCWLFFLAPRVYPSSHHITPISGNHHRPFFVNSDLSCCRRCILFLWNFILFLWFFLFHRGQTVFFSLSL